MSNKKRLYLSGLWKGSSANSPWSGKIRPQDIDKLIAGLEQYRAEGAEFVVFPAKEDSSADLVLYLGELYKPDSER